MPKKLFTKENAKEMQLKGAKNQAKSKSKNAAFKKYMKAWAESPCNNNEQRALESLGIVFDGDEILTKKAMLLIPLIKKASQGDLKAIEMILTELGENTKYELEIKKLKEENKKLKLEQKKLAIDTGINKDIEDLETLGNMLKEEPNANED